MAQQRTTPCHFFAQGKCAKGELCQFSHEILPAAAATHVPAPFKRNEPCKFFLTGTCVRGSSCQFVHDVGQRNAVRKGWAVFENVAAQAGGMQQPSVAAGMDPALLQLVLQQQQQQQQQQALLAGLPPHLQDLMSRDPTARAQLMAMAQSGNIAQLVAFAHQHAQGGPLPFHEGNNLGAHALNGLGPPKHLGPPQPPARLPFNKGGQSRPHDAQPNVKDSPAAKGQKRSVLERLDRKVEIKDAHRNDARAQKPLENRARDGAQRGGGLASSAVQSDVTNEDLEALIRRKGQQSKRKASDSPGAPAKSARGVQDVARKASAPEASSPGKDSRPSRRAEVKSTRQPIPAPAEKAAVPDIPLPKSRETIRKEKAAAAAAEAAARSATAAPQQPSKEQAATADNPFVDQAPTSNPGQSHGADLSIDSDILASQGEKAMLEMPRMSAHDDDDADVEDPATLHAATEAADDDLAQYAGMFD